MNMTEKRVNELLNYYKASRNVLHIGYEKNPEKFDKTSVDIALSLFDDTISIMKHVSLNPDLVSDLEESNTGTINTTKDYSATEK